MRVLLEAGAKQEKIVMGHLDRTIHEVFLKYNFKKNQNLFRLTS